MAQSLMVGKRKYTFVDFYGLRELARIVARKLRRKGYMVKIVPKPNELGAVTKVGRKCKKLYFVYKHKK